MPSGNKLLPEPMVIKFSGIIWQIFWENSHIQHYQFLIPIIKFRIHLSISNNLNVLTHWGRVRIYVSVNWPSLVPIMSCRRQDWTAPSHYRNQCWNIVNWILRNKSQWNFNHNSYIFIQENSFENVVCEMASTLSRPHCVNNDDQEKLASTLAGSG